MMDRADIFTEKYRHPIEYFKPAFGLVLLREVILGHDRFDYAFKKYIEHWAFKHPAPDDFFRTMDNEAVKILPGSGENGFKITGNSI